jgi:hypothetical protein
MNFKAESNVLERVHFLHDFSYIAILRLVCSQP